MYSGTVLYLRTDKTAGSDGERARGCIAPISRGTKQTPTARRQDSEGCVHGHCGAPVRPLRPGHYWVRISGAPGKHSLSRRVLPRGRARAAKEPATRACRCQYETLLACWRECQSNVKHGGISLNIGDSERRSRKNGRRQKGEPVGTVESVRSIGGRSHRQKGWLIPS